MFTRHRQPLRVLALAAVGVVSLVGNARANVVITIDTLINGAAASRVNNALPYATAIFSNNGANDVKLTMDLSNLIPSEFASTWLFNFNGNATSLTPTNVPGEVSGTTFTSSKALDGGSQTKAGLFNIELDFNTAGNQNRFNGGETISMDFLGTGITENDFTGLSISDGRNPGGWVSAMDVQGIPSTNGTTSGSLGGHISNVPEPAGFAFIGSLAVLAIPFLRKRKG